MDWHVYDILPFYPLMALTLLIVLACGYGLRMLRTKMQKGKVTRLMEGRLELLEQRTRHLEQANLDLQRLSYRDSLTGVSNRRHFEEALDMEWRRASRLGTALSLIMVDADFFKPFNDMYGHQRGDDCLVLIASTLRNAVNRPGDLVARYGGDEFMILIPGTNTQGAAELAETIRARIEAMQITHEGATAERVVTISLGVATGYPTRGLSSPALIAAADEALYQAKEEGRNQVIIAGEPMTLIRESIPFSN